MLTRLAATIVRRRRGVLVGALLVLVASFAYGGKVSTKLNNGGFGVPGSQSAVGNALLDNQFHPGDSNLVLLVTARSASVDSPPVAAAGRALTARLAGSVGVTGTASYWSLGSAAPLRSTDHRQALILAHVSGNEDQV